MQYPSRKALTGPHQWLRAHQATADAGLAAATFGAILLGTVAGARPYTLGPLTSTLAALACASLVLRRRYPWAVLALTCVLSALFIALRPADGQVPVIIAAAIALCTVAARTDRHTTWVIGLAACVGLTALTMAFGPGPWYGQAHFAVFAWTGMAAAAGDAVRSRRAYVAAVEERAVRAEQTREEEAKRRVAEERMRIARELHDVVAHHIALVNVQAGVAAHVMDSRPDQAKQALAHVREASRSALDELRATVGLLRQSGEPEAPMEPAPGLAVLDQLLDGFRRAGLHVTVEERTEGERGEGERTQGERGDLLPGPLPASVDLTAYRVIQESLTNVQKHAGPDAGAVVRISRGPVALEVVVDDDGTPGPPLPASDSASGPASAGTSPRPDAGAESPGPRGVPGMPGPGGSPDTGTASASRTGGHGLLGMYERASALGGVCRAGARPGGGFRVWVRLPLSAPPRTLPAVPPPASGGMSGGTGAGMSLGRAAE